MSPHKPPCVRNSLLLVSALMLCGSGCAKAPLEPTAIISPSESEDAGNGTGKDGGASGPIASDSGMPTLPGKDAGMANDAGSLDSGVPDAPCNIALSETFDADTILDGADDKVWSIANVGTSYTWYWAAGKDGPIGEGITRNTGSASKGGLYLVNSAEKKTPFDARLIPPVLQVANCKSLTLVFDHYLSAQSAKTKSSIEVRVDGGAWQMVKTWGMALPKQARHEEIDLTSYAIGKGKKVEVAFRYEDPDGIGIYWQLDDIKITAVAK